MQFSSDETRTMQQAKEYRTALILAAAAVAGAGLSSGCATHTATVESAPAHPWNSNETSAYQRYIVDQHLPYHPYSELSGSEQQEYWDWRAKHPG
jgi:hypothetical protein